MNQTVRRALSLVMAIAMVIALTAGMTACNEDDPSSETAVKDFGGRIFKIGAWWDRTPIEGKTIWDDAYIKKMKEIEDNCNCTIEFVTVSDLSETYVTTTLAGDPVCDIGTALTSVLLPGLIQGGIAYPVSDLAAFDFTSAKWLPSANNFGRYKGKNYCMDVKSGLDNCVRFGMFYNKRIFNEQGLPDLEELYSAGEWNWDKLLEVAKAVNTDTNGDGEIDTYAIGCEAFMWNFIYSNGGNVFTNDDGTVNATGFENPKVIEAMDFCAKFYSELGDALIPYDAAPQFHPGEMAMAGLELWHAQNLMASSTSSSPMVDDYGWVPFPCGPSSKGTYYSYGKEMSPYFMPSSVKEPNDVAWMFNAITNYAEDDAQWDEWLESIVETWMDDQDSVDNVMDMIASGNTIVNPLVGYTDLYALVQDMFGEIAVGSLTTQVALETYSNQITEAVKTANERDYTGEYQEQYEAMLNNEITDTTEFAPLVNDGTWQASAWYYTGEEPWFDTYDAFEAADLDPTTAYTFTRAHTVNDMIVIDFPIEQTFRKIYVDCVDDMSYPWEVKVQYKDNPDGGWIDVTSEILYGTTMEILLGKNTTACSVMVQILQEDSNRTWSIKDVRFEYVSKQ